MKIDAEQLRDFAERYTAAWCSPNPARVAAFFSTDGSLTINGCAPAVGRAAIREVVQGFMTAFPDLALTMDGVRVEGDRAVYQWTFAGTNTRPRGTGQYVSAGSRRGRSVRTGSSPAHWAILTKRITSVSWNTALPQPSARLTRAARCKSPSHPREPNNKRTPPSIETPGTLR